MAQVKILMHQLGGEQYVVSTLYVGSNNQQEVEKAMTEVGMPPSGWNAGYHYTAAINPDLDNAKRSKTLEEFKKALQRGERGME